MWSFTTSLLSKFVGLGPMQTFLRYIFKRISKDFLESQPNIDIKNGKELVDLGLLELGDMPLSSAKINKTILASSPYSMHRGLVRNVRITIPNLSQLAQKSIEVQIRGIQLELTPNKMFQKKFMEHLSQLKENSKFESQSQPQQLMPDDTTSVDFFKQLLSQIIKNIKVKIQNITIRLFMNSASSQNPSEYHCQLNIPLLNFQRFRDREIGKTNQEFQKYRLTMEQFCLSLPKTKQPSDCHSVLLIGRHDMARNNKSEVIFKISRNQKEKTKETSIIVSVTNIEMMLEPYQLKIISQFIKQIQDFKNLYKEVTNRFKKIQDYPLDESRDFEIHDIPQPKMQPSRSSRQNSMDLFMSVVMNFQDKAQELKRSRKSYFDEILLQNNSDTKMLKQEVKAIQKQIPSTMQQQIKQQEAISYTSTTIFRIQIDMVCLFFLKRVINCRRQWTKMTENGYETMNERIRCGYFMARLQGITIDIMKEQVNAKIAVIRVLDVTTENKHICANTLLAISATKQNEKIYGRMLIRENEPLTINVKKNKKQVKIGINASSVLVDVDISVICYFSQFIQKKQDIRQETRSLNYSTYEISHLSKRQHSDKSDQKTITSLHFNSVNIFLSNHKKPCYCFVNDSALALQLSNLSATLTKKTIEVKMTQAALSMFSITPNKTTLISQIVKISPDANKPLLLFQKIKSGFKSIQLVSVNLNKIQLNFTSSQQLNKYLEFFYFCLIDVRSHQKQQKQEQTKQQTKTPISVCFVCQHINIYYSQFGLFALNFQFKMEDKRLTFKMKQLLVANLSQYQTKIVSFVKKSEEVYDPMGYNTDRFSIPYQIGSDKIILHQKTDQKWNSMEIDRKVKMIEEKVTPERQGFCFTKPKKSQYYKTEEMVISLKLLETRVILTELQPLLKEAKNIMGVKKKEEELRRMLKKQDGRKEEKVLRFSMVSPCLIVDTWPSFKPGILHYTRNITLVQHFSLSFIKQEHKEFSSKLQKSEMQIDINSIKCQFLAFQDSSISKNPIILPIQFIQDYGFKNIVNLKKIKFLMNLKETKDHTNQPKQTIFDITLDHVNVGCSATTTIHIQQHLKLLLKKQHQAIEINDDLSQSSAQDLDEFSHKIQQKQQLFQDQNNLFKKQPHGVDPSLPLTNNFKITIKKSTINIYSGDDFSFIETGDYSRQDMDFALELDDNCEVVRKELIPDIKSYKVRFRDVEPNVFTALIVDVSTVGLEMKEYTEKNGKTKEIFLKIGESSIFLDIIHQERFTLLKFKNNISVSVCSDEALWVRCDHLPKITCGFHSGINFIKNQRRNFNKILENSAFYRLKPKLVQVASNKMSIVLFIPQFTACVDVRLIGIQLLNCQQLTVSQLFVPRSVYSVSFEEYVKRWLKNIISSNLGNVLGNAFLSLLYQGLIFTFSVVKQVVVLPGQLVRNFIV